MSISVFILILTGVLLNAGAQLLLKAGTNALGQLFNDDQNIINSIARIVFEPHIFSGLACYVFSVGIWILALSRTQVSIAYPMLSIGYVVNVFAAWYLLGESISMQKILAISIISIGVYILAKS